MENGKTNLLGYRHALIHQTIERFTVARPLQEVSLFLFPCATAQPGSARGFVSNQMEAVPRLTGDAVLQGLVKTLGRVAELCVGDYVHIAVESRLAGRLHLFNFGTSGDVARLQLSNHRETMELPAGRAVLVTAGESDVRTACRELGDSEEGRLGRANGHPERLLALVTEKPTTITAGDLHPEWLPFDHRFRSVAANPWTSGTVRSATAENTFLGTIGNNAWAWGWVEVSVVDPSNAESLAPTARSTP